MIRAGSKKSRIEGPVLVLLHTLPRTINHLSGHAMPVTLLGHCCLYYLLTTGERSDVVVIVMVTEAN